MRGLVLAAILGVALPALAADDSVPAMGAVASEEVASTSERTGGDDASAVEPKPAEPVPARPPVPADAVARGTFATAIDQREPVDSVTSLESDRSRVYYFNEFVGIDGREVTHRWEYRGEVMAEVPISIDGPRWRAYSSKNLDASQLGEWTVSVIDDAGHVVRKDSFVYEEAAPAQEIAAPAAPAATPSAPAEAPDEAPASPAPAQP